jgi:hypothetical protein
MEQPASSPILTARFSGDVLLYVPPVGLRKKGSGRFLFWFSFPWFGFALLAPASWVVFALFGAQLPAEMIAINAVGMVLTLGVGTASLLAGINLARRQAILAVAEGQLLIIQMGPFGSKRVEWAREDIATIGIGYIGLKVQNVPVVELQVQPIDGGRFGILAGRDGTELEWLATTLRRELHVPPPDRLPSPKPA